VEPPDISVEVVQFRPFYILGDIERPGEYAFRPGLTVLQAVAIAGGMTRNGLNQARLEREAISTKGSLALLETELMATLVRQARLTSERDGRSDIALPQDLKLTASGAVFGRMMEQETQLFHSRRDGFATQLWALEHLKSLHEKEAQSLVKQLETHETHVRLVNEELDGVMQLYKQKLTTAPRKLALERNVAQLQGDRVRLETALARAYQEAGRTEIALLDLRNRRQTEITDELRKAQVRLDEIGSRLRTAEELLYDTEVTAPRQVAMRAQGRKNQPVYTVVRQSSGRSVEVQATETMTLEPGDTVKIELPTVDPAQLEFARRRDSQAPASMSPEMPGHGPLAPSEARAGETPIRY
jgi:polysaccharide export outer membrane protein/exopolysaccharide production protein ExoF